MPPASPCRPDPWAVLLSEMMLQQTTVAAAAPRFQPLLARWPRAEAMATSPVDEVMEAWAGLGYYSRARSLHAAAVAITRAGGFPADAKGLRQLPGVGPYTAAAVAAIAFGEPVVPLDSNVERVTARLFAIATPLPRARAELGTAIGRHAPADRPGDFAQALMDLGSLICTPRTPRCGECPLAACCKARALGLATALPVKPARRARPERFGACWWIGHRGMVGLVRRPPRGLLGGMLALPGSAWGPDRARPLPFPASWRWLDAPVVHGFTHFRLSLSVAVAEVDAPPADLAGVPLVWQRPGDARLPGLYAAVRQAVAAAAPRVRKEPGR